MTAALATLPGVREEAERLARETWDAMRAVGAEINTRTELPTTRPMETWEETTPGVRAWWCEMTLRLLGDITRPASRDWWARWLAERVGLTVGATAPTWWRMRVHPVWCLSVPNGPGSACFADDFTTDNPNGMTRGPMVHVPGISALTDPAAALAAACLAVGGAS